DLPEASADLVPLAKANLAVVPAYMVGDADRPAAPAAEPSAARDLALDSFVVGVDELPPARRPASTAECSELASGTIADAAHPSYQDAVAPVVGESRPEGPPLGALAFQCPAWLGDLAPRDDRSSVLAQTLLVEALAVLVSWRLTRRAAPPDPRPRPDFRAH